MAATSTLEVPHLGGTTVGFKLANDLWEAHKPTLVMINSVCTTVSLFNSQFEEKKLTETMNLLAIEPLGHGSTSSPVEHFNCWDTAIVALQTLDCLGIKEAFVLGTSQGGWIAVRMALLAPERVLGLLLLGTSMDYESSASREKGCWNPFPIIEPFMKKWEADVGDADFVVDDDWCNAIINIGFGQSATPELKEFWTRTLKEVYKGEEGRKKVRMTSIALGSRDGLLMRVSDIICPIHWLQGTTDIPYGTKVQEDQFFLFTSSEGKRLTYVDGGEHYLNATHPQQVNEAILEFVKKYTEAVEYGTGSD